MNENNRQRIETALTTILIVVIAVIAVGTAAIPTVMAFRFGWLWVFAYPALLVILFAWARANKKKG